MLTGECMGKKTKKIEGNGRIINIWGCSETEWIMVSRFLKGEMKIKNIKKKWCCDPGVRTGNLKNIPIAIISCFGL